MKKIAFIVLMCTAVTSAYGTTVVATVNGTPITDTDITARTKLMARQGNTSTTNRRQALQNIIDDSVKLKYAENFNVSPDDKVVEQQLRAMNLGEMTAPEWDTARNALRAEMAWQMVVAHTILPMVDVTKEEIAAEKNSLERQRGLPIEMTIVRLIGVPEVIAATLTKPKSCDDAMEMARKFGGAPQKFTAVQYELAEDIRSRVVTLPLLTWSGRKDDSVLLVCDKKKTSEYGKLDEIIKQNAMYKQAMSMAEQQLKQLRRKAVVIINDDRYKL